MNTVYIINSLEGGGAERVFAQLVSMVACDHANPERIEVVLLDIEPEAYALPDQVIITRIGGSGATQFFRLLRLLRQRKPTLIVSFLTRSNIMNVVASKWLGNVSIISERSNTSGRLTGKFARLKRCLVSSIYRQADAVIAVSAGVADCLTSEFGVSESKVVVLNNPVDTQRISELAVESPSPSMHNTVAPKETSIVAMGRLVKSKGFNDLLNAYARSGLSCGLTILGDGPERTALESLAGELGIADEVSLLGFVSNPYVLLKSAEIFVLSSHLEGFPNALVEAMALQTAVIATDCNDGPREILELTDDISAGKYRQANCGLMVSVADTEAMAEAMVCLSQQIDLRKRLIEKATERVADFSKQQFYRDYIKTVERVCGEAAA